MDECLVHGVVRMARLTLSEMPNGTSQRGAKKRLAFSEKRAAVRTDFLKYLPLLVDALSRCRMEYKVVISRRVIEVEHAVQFARDRIGRAVADPRSSVK